MADSNGGFGQWSWGDLVPLAGAIIGTVGAVKVANAQRDAAKSVAAQQRTVTTAQVQTSALNSQTVIKVALIGVAGLLGVTVIAVGARALAK